MSLLTFYFHITHVDGSVLETEGRDFPDLHVATEEARERLQDLVATALLSTRHRVPLGIAICSKKGTILREVSVDAAITEIARSHQSRDSTFLGTSANSGTNAGGVSKVVGRAEVSSTQRPFDTPVRPTSSIES
ncbi:DUF6894 family protein [Rhizobium laguerreae]|uniref:DUF6894 family protein n=1 Tax=Rhizobium laguerreae TaxID=1076926 RepID=UPI0028AF903E|nr:hypothetical protein [Rhizobium laguerreae]